MSMFSRRRQMYVAPDELGLGVQPDGEACVLISAFCIETASSVCGGKFNWNRKWKGGNRCRQLFLPFHAAAASVQRARQMSLVWPHSRCKTACDVRRLPHT